jgi:hypothetical protein
MTTSSSTATAPALEGAAQDLQPSELAHAREYLQQTRDGVAAATEGLSEAQWRFKPAPECWSIAEILEHMVLTQELIMGPVFAQLATAPPAPADHDARQIDTLIVGVFPERTAKFKGPEILAPTGRWTPSEATARLTANCVRLSEYLESTPGLRQHAVESRPLKAISKGEFQVMDGYQWVLAIAAHTERHTRQILEVKADAQFPG